MGQPGPHWTQDDVVLKRGNVTVAVTDTHVFVVVNIAGKDVPIKVSRQNGDFGLNTDYGLDSKL
jgi:hypothetical protein